MCTSSHTRVPIEGWVEKPTHVVTTSPVTQSRITSPSRAQALYFVLSRPPTSPFLGVSRGLLSLEQCSCPQSASYAPIHSTSVCLVGLHRGFDQCPAFRTGPSCTTSLLRAVLLRCGCQRFAFTVHARLLLYARPSTQPSITDDVVGKPARKEPGPRGRVAISLTELCFAAVLLSPDTCPYLCACTSRQLRNPRLYSAPLDRSALSCPSDKGHGRPPEGGQRCPTRLP